ncbi:MARVEL domain-containing protein 3-like isoform X1 [Hypanus sabinus]|uniref:MARVEL domain-containing protein 3-like isoform X1 n=1 Tax=Hypanus sabinus TaxID=79690 RepID=UPI0028C3FD32|nr:MARVEL domain-containing protein 3-like isoform X1 [Hypanus sabinus]XP_059801283.1 MARVEL domain-containing protein 3-like isoform X1 [Hypanus sabinus]XP_059801284.1 MARVEL domain-containing protein 3-like isoform X1 [Hypanus sabinus]
MSYPSKVPRNSDGSHSSNNPHRERRPRDRPHPENSHSGRRSREDPRDNHQSKPSREPYPSSKRHSRDSVEETYSRPPTTRGTPSQPDSIPSSSAPPFYSAVSQANSPPKESFGTKCSYLCSRRGVLQFSEITTNLMVLICVAASQAAISGYTSMGGLGIGSFSIDSAYSPFQGTELKQIRELDMQFNQMRTPGVYGGVTVSIVLGCLTILFLVGGGKPLHRISPKLLMAEFAFNIIACIGYIVGVGLYLHLMITVNSTEVCRLRHRLYAGRGYTFMNCDIQGGDAAVALFGLISACLYCGSAVLSFLTLRSLKKILRNMHLNNSVQNYLEEDEYKNQAGHQEVKPNHNLSTLV